MKRSLVLLGLALVVAALLFGVTPVPPAEALGTTPCATATTFDTLAVKADGTLWAWGANACGELGTGNTLPYTVPTQIGSASDWKAVALGGGWYTCFAVAIKQDGTLWSWGSNLATAGDTLVPTQIGSATDWQSVACGGLFAAAIRSDGTLWTWGSNQWGQLGYASVADQGSPQQVGSASDWASVACGPAYTMAITTDNTLWAWGQNNHGQLGIGASDESVHDLPVEVGSSSDWASVACSQDYAFGGSTLAVRTDHTLWAWGNNEDGQLGNGTMGDGDHPAPTQVGTSSSWTAVSCGDWHVAALQTDGTLWTWGRNDAGQLGYDSGIGFNWEVPTQVGTATDWAGVACGRDYTIAIHQDGSFATFGANDYGQLGIGYPNFRYSPTQVGTVGGWQSIAPGEEHTLGVRADGTLWAWGDNSAGQLGISGNASAPDTTWAPVQVGTDTNWQQAAAGSDYSLAIKTDGTLWAWGDNALGKLGIPGVGSPGVPLQVGTDSDWAQVACGSSHTAAIRTDGTLWTWGDNSDGELGRTVDSSHPSDAPGQVGSEHDWKFVVCGDELADGGFTVALKTDGSLWAWGQDDSGQLGLGASPLPGPNVTVPTRSGSGTWESVACGNDSGGPFVLAIRSDGTLWGWGGNNGQLGVADITPRSSPVEIGTDSDWASVAAGGRYGNQFGAALKTDGTLWTWGDSFTGQLGEGSYLPVFFQPPHQVGSASDWASLSCGRGLYALTSDGSLWTCGDNTQGQLGLGDPATYPTPLGFQLTNLSDDTTPPTVTASVAPLSTSSAVRMPRSSPGDAAIGAASRFGTWYRAGVKVRFTSTDTGSGVSRTELSSDGGVSWADTTTLKVTQNGATKILYRAIDRAGNATRIFSRTVYVDSLRPVPLAPSAASCRHGGKATLRYKVKDICVTVNVRIVIRNSHKKAVKTLTLKGKPVNKLLKARFTCKLAKGRYKFYVYATDQAGNRQVKAASNRLTVR